MEVSHKQLILNSGHIRPTTKMVTGISLMIQAYNDEDRLDYNVCARIQKVNLDPWP
jgi:hypothetical protein